jgi:hypothetical protein
MAPMPNSINPSLNYYGNNYNNPSTNIGGSNSNNNNANTSSSLQFLQSMCQNKSSQ